MRDNTGSFSLTLLAFVALTLPITAAPAVAQQETVLHNFLGSGKGGSDPSANVIVGAAGSVFGTASQGGTNGVGAVFEFTEIF